MDWISYWRSGTRDGGVSRMQTWQASIYRAVSNKSPDLTRNKLGAQKGDTRPWCLFCFSYKINHINEDSSLRWGLNTKHLQFYLCILSFYFICSVLNFHQGSICVNIYRRAGSPHLVSLLTIPPAVKHKILWSDIYYFLNKLFICAPWQICLSWSSTTTWCSSPS